MEKTLAHEIELYSPDAFKTLLDHEVNRSRRYGEPLSLIHLIVEADPNDPYAQHGAELFAINALNLHLRDTDIPCKKGNEFQVLMPSTDQKGGRIVCERLEELFHVENQVYDKVSFRLLVHIGMATLQGDRSITSKKIMDNASQAVLHARENQIDKTVIFSEIRQ